MKESQASAPPSPSGNASRVALLPWMLMIVLMAFIMCWAEQDPIAPLYGVLGIGCFAGWSVTVLLKAARSSAISCFFFWIGLMGAHLQGLIAMGDALVLSAILELAAVLMIWLGFHRVLSRLTGFSYSLFILSLLLVGTDAFLRWQGAGNWLQVQHVHYPDLKRNPAHRRMESVSYGDLVSYIADSAYAVPHNYHFETDEWGFNNSPGNADRENEVIVLGDSYCDTPYRAQFARLLDTAFAVPTYNLGMAATSPWEQLLNFQLEVDHVRHTAGATLLWCLFAGNDLHERYDKYYDIQAAPRTRGLASLRVRLKNHRLMAVLPILTGELLSSLHLTEISYEYFEGQQSSVLPVKLKDGTHMLFLKPYHERYLLDSVAVQQQPNFAQMVTCIRRMQNLTRQHGLGLKIVLIPSKEEVYDWIYEGLPAPDTLQQPSGFSKALGDVCGQLGIDYHDAKPPLRRQAITLYAQSGEFVWWRDDSHINQRGHAILADFLYHEVLQVNPR